MKFNTKRGILSAAGLLLSARNALAVEATNASSTDIVGNLGFFSTIAGTIIIYAKYIAFFIAILSLFALWSSGQIAKFSRKVEGDDNLQGWLTSKPGLVAELLGGIPIEAGL